MITVKVNAGIGTVILDRPQQCNALNRDMVHQLAEAFEDLRQEKRVRGIILAGSGPHFCTGMDLKELQSSSLDDDALSQWHETALALKELLEQLLQLPKPIVAAVDGAAMATGLALVLACDLVVASHRSTFSVPAARMGLVSGLVAPLLCFRVGGSLASRMVLGGDELSASEAKSLGLVHHLVESNQVWVRSSVWLDTVAAGAAESLQLSKRVLNEMVGESLTTMLASGAAATATSLTTDAAQEGLNAFVNKRTPNFPR
jgi:enoyl-CoA hydratase/carnithine racemase